MSSLSSSSVLLQSMLDAPRRRIKRHLRSWRTRMIIVTRLSLLTDFNQVRAYFETFGTVADLRFKSAPEWRYVKCCVVTMERLSDASRILLQRMHIIDGARVRVDPHRGYADIRQLLVKGDYRLHISGLKQGEHEANLNRTIEETFRDTGPHTTITIKKDDDMTTNGRADVWFVREFAASQAQTIAIARGWGAELHGP